MTTWFSTSYLDVSRAETANSAHSEVTTLFWLLIAVALVAVATKYIRLPYTIVLVLAGAGLALVPQAPGIVLTPDLIVLVFLPALLFEASYHLSFEHLKADFRFISNLALWGVVATAGLIAVLLVGLGGLAWPTALLFGAIVAATDPVSVVATFRKLGAPTRLTSIIESESLFNDGSALVLFNLLLSVIVAGQFSVWSNGLEFIKVAVGGLALGVATGYLALALLSRLDEYLTEILVTLIVAYGSFLAAEQLGVSPALAVVAAGLLVGNFGQRQALSPTTQIALGFSWEFFGFLANSLIFLLVGLQVRTIQVGEFWPVIGLGIVATLLSRGIVVVVLSGLNNLLQRRVVVSWRWQMLLIWGGLRGALSLAMALSLPLTLLDGKLFPDRNMLLVMTFGLIMFSLLVQGLTIEPLMKFLKLGNQTSAELSQYELLKGQIFTARALCLKIQEMRNQHLISEEAAASLLAEYEQKEQNCSLALRELQVNNEFLQEEQMRTARRQLVQAEKESLNGLYFQGIISEPTLRRLQAAIEEVENLPEAPQPKMSDVAMLPVKSGLENDRPAELGEKGVTTQTPTLTSPQGHRWTGKKKRGK